MGKNSFHLKKRKQFVLSSDIRLTVRFPIYLIIVALLFLSTRQVSLKPICITNTFKGGNDKADTSEGSKQKAHLCNVLALNY